MIDRRGFLALCSQLGFGSTMLPAILWAMAEPKSQITVQMIDAASKTADVPISDDSKLMMLDSLNDFIKDYDLIYALKIPNDVPPAIVFDPIPPGMKLPSRPQPKMYVAPMVTTSAAPRNLEDVAFFTVRQLGDLVRTRKVSSSALTEMYLERLKRYDPLLKFVITLTEDRARAKAREADQETAAGKYRGPLHGIPWGAKDLLAVKGYRTTWGAGGFESQMIDQDATVVQRLDAGAQSLSPN